MVKSIKTHIKAVAIINNINMIDNNFSMDFVFATSADIYKGCSYRVLDNTLYIKIKSVLVGRLGKPSKISIDRDFTNITQVILEYDDTQKVICTKEIP